MKRRKFLLLAILAAASAMPAAGQTQGPAQAAASIPDFSRFWRHQSLPGLEPLASGPTSLTNRSRRNGVSDYNQLVGDYKNPILQPWAAAIVKRWAEETHAGHPPAHAHALCYPTSLPGVMTLHNAYQFLQTPEKVTIIIANQTQARHIYLNVPHSKHVTPSWYGESVGHYEGDTLVVDTVGINERGWIDAYGTPTTKQLHLVEKWTRLDFKTLRYEITIDDPGAYTAPFTTGMLMTYAPGREMFEFVCQDGNLGGELMIGGGNSKIDRSSPIVP